jgi:hypothetical protein
MLNQIVSIKREMHYLSERVRTSVPIFTGFWASRSLPTASNDATDDLLDGLDFGLPAEEGRLDSESESWV